MKKSDNTPVIIMIAGANGSGKTSFYRALTESNEVDLGSYVNTNDPQRLISTSSFNNTSLKTVTKFINQNLSFTLETTMADNVDVLTLMRNAKARGFRIALIYIGTIDPAINCERVKLRMECGGDNVPEECIIDSYFQSLNKLKEAIEIADHTELYDNSSVMHPMVCHIIINKGCIETRHPELVMPEWVINVIKNNDKKSA